MNDDKKKTVLTGMQPTGCLHLGNVLGAANNWNKMLNDYRCLFFIPNLHAITVPQVPETLRSSTLSCIAQYIACGLDPAKCKIFVQSHVVGHTELAWVLGCLTPLGQLQRMHQFKDKSQKQESIYSGLLYYPVLMAADILLYNADLVPVGEDQKQHVELTRDIAEKFNNTYSVTFTLPEPLIGKTGARIMSLQDPKRKMSKSDKDPLATVFITDDEKTLRKKIMSAVTDSENKIRIHESQPGISNLLNIYCAITGITLDEAEDRFAAYDGYAKFKEEVAGVVIDFINPIREHYKKIKDDKEYLIAVIRDGLDTAQPIANNMMAKVYRKVGFLSV